MYAIVPIFIDIILKDQNSELCVCDFIKIEVFILYIGWSFFNLVIQYYFGKLNLLEFGTFNACQAMLYIPCFIKTHKNILTSFIMFFFVVISIITYIWKLVLKINKYNTEFTIKYLWTKIKKCIIHKKRKEM